jgi:uncharacterized membrane protein YgcG
MKKIVQNGYRMFILLAVAMFILLQGVFAAENITYTYRTSDDSVVLASNWTDQYMTNVTLPNISWNLELQNNDSMFKILFNSLNHSDYGVFDLEASRIDTGSQSYQGAFGETSDYDYIVYYGYGFNASQFTDAQYMITLDYSPYYPSDITAPVIFKCPFDFVAGQADTSNCSMLSTTVNVAQKKAIAYATNFSSFFLTQYVGSSGGSGNAVTGGGGGSGGSADGGDNRIVYVTPTPEGASVQVYDGDELIIQFGGEEYHFRVVDVSHLKVKLKNLASYITHEINIGDNFRLGLKSYFSDDVRISMHVSNQFAMLTFTIPEKSSPVYSLNPPAKRTTPTGSQVSEPVEVVSKPSTSASRPRVEQPAQPSGQVELPDSPIDIWTIIIAFVFALLLIGGVAAYRYGLFDHIKPPTVTGTGQPPSEGYISAGAAPSRNLTSQEEITEEVTRQGSEVSLQEEESEVLPQAQEEKLVIERKGPKVEEELLEEKPYVKLDLAQKLDLEKFVFHALSQGFTEKQITDALLKKGWSRLNIEEILGEVAPKGG